MDRPDIVVHIVDDEKTVRSSLAFLLSNCGFEVQTHPTATIFLSCAQVIRQGCLVTDLRMPDMDGIELLRRLREVGAQLPVIIITGHGDLKVATQAIKNGAADFIEKPFAADVLINAIHRAVDLASASASQTGAAGIETIKQRLGALSDSEVLVLRGVIAGAQNRAIALELGVSLAVIEGLRAGLMAKAQAKSLPELIRMAMALGLEGGTIH
ncbi:MAG: fixJ [Hyphomicrobiales bacterium]|nr:fixJ [Hyphomicrobiales bacterium]